MPRRERPSVTRGSEYWLRILVNQHAVYFNHLIAAAFEWNDSQIEWKSPVRYDDFAEYYDQDFLDRLNVTDLMMPLNEFWPRSGPRWDGLARTDDGKLILLEAKAHIEECIDFRSRASGASIKKIYKRLDEAKKAFHASKNASWYTPFYQMANRLAHLYYLSEINEKDAYMVFLYFANAPDVKNPVSHESWDGAIRLAWKCLGLSDCILLRRVAHIIINVKEINCQVSLLQLKEARVVPGMNDR